jgi:predicted MPP superfamily phosphohydrolase
VKVFLASIIIRLLLEPYVFWRSWNAIPPKRSFRITLAVAFASEFLLFLFGYFFYKRLSDDAIDFILWICNTWYIALLYITMLTVPVDLLNLSDRVFHWFPNCIANAKSKIKRALFFIIPLIVALLLVHANDTARNPVVRPLYLELPKGDGNRLDSLKIVMMSDIHIGEMIGKDMIAEYVRLSNEQQPDMVVLVGDLLDLGVHIAERDDIAADLRRLKAPLGVYAVNGNHEYRANRFANRKWIRSTGAVLLTDSVVCIDSSFYLIGRDDYVNKKRLSLQALMRDLNDDKPSIVLDHQPHSIAELAMNGVALSLHGHTHNGQLWPYPLVMKLAWEIPYGYYRKGNTQYYVSSGVGFAGPPYRVGTVSEIVVLNIHFVDD